MADTGVKVETNGGNANVPGEDGTLATATWELATVADTADVGTNCAEKTELVTAVDVDGFEDDACELGAFT